MVPISRWGNNIGTCFCLYYGCRIVEGGSCGLFLVRKVAGVDVPSSRGTDFVKNTNRPLRPMFWMYSEGGRIVHHVNLGLGGLARSII